LLFQGCAADTEGRHLVSGYSDRSAAAKVGVKTGMRLAVLDAPVGWHLQGLPDGVELVDDRGERPDVVIAFMRSASDLRSRADRLEVAIQGASSLWICWPRKAGGHRSDVTENLVREVFLPTGLVDVKVAALDEDWSGLKLVRRRQHRGEPT
jgi:hypothetical protein